MTAKTSHFQGQTSLRVDNPPILHIFMSVKTLAMEPVVPEGQNDSFSRLNKPLSSPWIIGDPDFRHHFCQNLSWTSLKTLAMELVGLDGQNNSFSMSNDPRRRIRHHFF
ncbi:hypothetical protein H5410_052995 [Solanum commersonii]|uniref:Uncharacterized protein n=1 Tax=Solanum commersonii TaxID=4109 RepID=A0A9J5X5T4_SOLCO|nr:hypothetical protein H5410_052995 [Solanum commersonii]